MLYRALNVSLKAIALLFVFTSPALAQNGKPFSMSSSPRGEGGGGKGGYRSFLLAMPIVTAGRGTVGRMEFNLAARGALAIEGSYKGPKEDIPASDQKKTGESMITKGRSVALLYAHYSQPNQMAGFYYGLGGGYRQESADWKVRPDGSVTAAALDQKTSLNHQATLTGPTAHLRGGYRYMGSDIPLLIGAYVGVRHFEATVKDEDAGGGTTNGVAYTALTDAEKASLKRRFATAPEIGLEIGFAL